MSQQSGITINQIDDTGATGGPSIQFNPHRERNGVFEYSGKQSAVVEGYLAPNARARITASLRPGVAANFVTKAERVKRRVNARVELPINVPGPEGSTVIDYMNVDLTISVPVEASYKQIGNALHVAHASLYATYLQGNTPLDDMLTGGNEPY